MVFKQNIGGVLRCFAVIKQIHSMYVVVFGGVLWCFAVFCGVLQWFAVFRDIKMDS